MSANNQPQGELTVEAFDWLLELTASVAKRLNLRICPENEGKLGAIQVAVIKAYCRGAGIPITSVPPPPPPLMEAWTEGGDS